MRLRRERVAERDEGRGGFLFVPYDAALGLKD